MVRKRRLFRILALVAGLSLLAAACGDDDDDGEAGGDGEETTTTEGEDAAATGGELEGLKGTTPAPETTAEVEAFQARMTEHDPALEDFSYGPETYDTLVIIALAAAVAGDDGSAHAAEIVNVTKEGEQCATYADCLALVQAGTDIDYQGISGATDMSGNGEPLLGTYAVLQMGGDNQLDDSLTEFRSAEASEEFQTMANDPVTVQRAGDGTLTFGLLLPETGNLAFLGPPEIAGAELALEDINAAGGFNGTPAVMFPGDSGDTTTDIATQTVTSHLGRNVDAIVGAASSSVSASVIDQISTAGVTMFSPANTSKQFSDYPDEGLYFRLGPSDILQGQVLAEVVIDDGVESVVVLNFDDDYGNGLAEDFIESYEASGGTVADTAVYDPQTQTFDAEVQVVVGADPDGVVLVGFEETARLLAALVEQGFGPTDIPTYGVDGNMSNALGTNFEEAS
jgi:ABC-type branched-subunit amino acid transport system substrate-binding protein